MGVSRSNARCAQRRPANAAGDPGFIDFAAILDDQQPLAHYSAKLSPSVDNAALDERVALNAVLLGHTQTGFESAQRVESQVDHWGPTARDPILGHGPAPPA